MSESPADWIRRGRGATPRLRWSFSTEAPLVSLQLARESGDVLAADAVGSLYLLNRSGKLSTVTRGRSELRLLAWSDTGDLGVAVVGDRRLYWLNRQLNFQGFVDLPDSAAAIAIESYGQYAVVSQSPGDALIYDRNRKLIRHLETPQPWGRVACQGARPEIIWVSSYGLLGCHDFQGPLHWQEKLWANVGDLAITGDGERILLACYSHGIQCHDHTGTQIGSYQIGGTVSKVAASYLPKRIAAATVENELYWIGLDGQILWQATVPEPVAGLLADPLGQGMVCGLVSGRICSLEWPQR
jgi:hypothetical protein